MLGGAGGWKDVVAREVRCVERCCGRSEGLLGARQKIIGSDICRMVS